MQDETQKGEQAQGQNVSRRAIIGTGALGVAAVAGASMLKSTEVLAQTRTAPPGTAQSPLALTERNITYRSGDVDMKAFLVRPATQNNGGAGKLTPAVMVIHEIWGLNDHIRDVARRIARQGYIALAPDLFTREGPPQLDATDRPAIMKFIGSIPDRRMVADLEAGLTYLKGQQVGAGRIGSVGFCMGGLYSYLLATHSTNLAAAVDFYGRIVYAEKTENKPDSPLDLASQLKCPLLGNFGELDASIPVADVEKLREQLKVSRQPWKINIYPGAGHAFFNDTRQSYKKEAAADAWNEMLEFFKTHLR